MNDEERKCCRIDIIQLYDKLAKVEKLVKVLRVQQKIRIFALHYIVWQSKAITCR